MSRLTIQEQQEIIRYLEVDKPLPEKYRFFLFDDKREVELVWRGKNNDVCNVQSIEHVNELRSEPFKSSWDEYTGRLFRVDSRGGQLKRWSNKLAQSTYKIAVKVVDNFGNDNMTIVEARL